jgi:hypothetical protein
MNRFEPITIFDRHNIDDGSEAFSACWKSHGNWHLSLECAMVVVGASQVLWRSFARNSSLEHAIPNLDLLGNDPNMNGMSSFAVYALEHVSDFSTKLKCCRTPAH